ncbi:hypothetical protein GCM10025783_30010 [Amnibacterium soli]|jgi:hypothetical protein|uniref:Putative zinc-finger domain-containing protein n=1 Tax=Amnibacterium soli TaxID=1282736 RepID=A0ABP8ZER3_9MICO
MTDDEPHLLLGAYVLGGLTSHDRARFEDHLTSCARCRNELAATAGIPALLRLTASTTATGVDVPIHTVSRRRAHPRRRRIAIAVVAAAAVAAVVTVFALLGPGTAHPDATFTATGRTAVSGSAVFEPKPWGTAIELDLANLPRNGTFTLQVRSRTGTTERAATWSGTTRARIQVTAATSIPSSDIAALQILTTAPGSRPIADADPAT